MSTYFASDLAYHRNKFERGFQTVVDIWEPTTMPTSSACSRSPGAGPGTVRPENHPRTTGQPPQRWCARRHVDQGREFVTLKEVVDEVGKDAARFIFLTRRSDSPLDFDLEVAKMQSNDNPVYYVQYAHARLCSIFEVARERGIEASSIASSAAASLHRLTLPHGTGSHQTARRISRSRGQLCPVLGGAFHPPTISMSLSPSSTATTIKTGSWGKTPS